MAVSNHVYSTPIKTVPGYLSLQVHPQDEISKTIELATMVFSVVKQSIWQEEFSPNSVAGETPEPEEEKDLLKDLMRFPPHHDKVPQLMNEFAEELSKKIAAKEEIISMMAWAHQKLVSTHPYYDGNGRTARLMMSLLAMWAGKKPLLIANAIEYGNAAKSLDPVQFADYLRKLEGQQPQISTFFDQCLRQRFIDLRDNDAYKELCAKVNAIKVANQ